MLTSLTSAFTIKDISISSEPMVKEQLDGLVMKAIERMLSSGPIDKNVYAAHYAIQVHPDGLPEDNHTIDELQAKVTKLESEAETTDRLKELLKAKDKKIAKLERKITSLEEEVAQRERDIENGEGGWTISREVDDVPGLPLPRLEIRWHHMYKDQGPDDWGSYRTVYSLIVKHLVDHCVRIPLGITTSHGHDRRTPWANGDEVRLPFRDGAHIHHDAAHLGLPAYAVFPDGTHRRLDSDQVYSHQSKVGLEHRREPEERDHKE